MVYHCHLHFGLVCIVLSTAHLDHQVPDFCPREVMHLRVLNHYVSVGDLILFQCAGPMGALQRSVSFDLMSIFLIIRSIQQFVCQVTGSEWDHVGIVVPANTTAAFHLLEATGDGVSVSPLVRLLYRCYIGIQISWLTFPTGWQTACIRFNSYKMHSTSETPNSTAYCSCSPRSVAALYIRGKWSDVCCSLYFQSHGRCAVLRIQVEGMPYGLSISKLLQPRSNGRGNFFCSELVGLTHI